MCADAAGRDTTQVCVKKMGSPNVFKHMRFCNQYSSSTMRFDIGASPPSCWLWSPVRADAAGRNTMCVKKIGSPNVFEKHAPCNQYTLRFDIGASPPIPRRLDRLCVQMQEVETLHK